jgi:hypothetical protein
VLAARARDGYAAAFGLAEVDPRFGRQVPIVVWQEADGMALPPHRGPLMLLAPEDGRASRGVRQLQSLQVLALPEHPLNNGGAVLISSPDETT